MVVVTGVRADVWARRKNTELGGAVWVWESLKEAVEDEESDLLQARQHVSGVVWRRGGQDRRRWR